MPAFNMSKEKEFRRVSFEQLQSMVEFMGQHVDLAMGLPRSMEFRHKCKKLWAELTKIMHKQSGARKTADGWSKYWSDYKNKLKNKIRLIKLAKRKNELSSVTLSKMDKRVILILGKNYFGKRVTVPRIPTEQSNSINYSRTQTDLNDESTDYGNISEGSDRTSDDDVGDALPVLNVDCERPISSDLNMDSVCPQWLIDTEQKRAEADLIRAQAEELKANVAAKNAESFTVQAESLKKLAEAATLQAEALTKIAAMLEPIATAMVQRIGPGYGFRD